MASLAEQTDPQLAASLGLTEEAVARAAAVHDAVVRLPVPLEEQARVLEELSEGPGADIGATYALAIVKLGPVEGLGVLTSIKGIGPKRLTSVIEALAQREVAEVAKAAGIEVGGEAGGGEAGGEAGGGEETGGGTETGGGAETDSSLLARIAALEAAVEALENQRISDAERIAALEAQLANAGSGSGAEAPKATVSAGDATRLSVIAESAGEQLHEARNRLLGSRSGLRLGDVELQVRGEAGVSPDAMLGLRLQTEAIDPNRLSEVTLRYGVDGGRVLTRLQDPVQVPTLTGYTEALARRKLGKVRLEADVSRQAVDDRSKARTVVAQDPAPGSTVEAGTTVRVFLGV